VSELPYVLPTYRRSIAAAPPAAGAAAATRRARLLVCALCVLLPNEITAQATPHPLPARTAAGVNTEVASLIARGDKGSAARQPLQALALYEQALDRDSLSFDALWRASRESVDLGEFEPDRKKQAERYARADRYARQALALHPDDADVHFHVARAIGRTAMSVSPRDRVKYAVQVRAHALEALELNPRHAGALHVMGVWNAEVMRLNGIARAFAKAFMGGKVMSTASWEEAARYLDETVELEPNRLVHRLDQARIYRDMGRKADARAAFEAALRAPLLDANDDRYRRAAEDELKALR